MFIRANARSSQGIDRGVIGKFSTSSSRLFEISCSNIVIASASEAIQAASKELDCFVASAPRNDVDGP
jgi:hypothetical protein